MKSAIAKILAAMMLLSMVVVPLQAATATENPQASPVIAPDTTTDEGVTPATPEGEAEEVESETLAGPDSIDTLSTGSAAVQSLVPTNNGDDTFDVVVTIFLEEGFQRLDGEAFTFVGGGYWWGSNVTFLGVSLGTTSLPLEIQTTPAPEFGGIVVLATGDFIIPAGGATVQLTLEVDVEFLDDCRPEPGAYYRTTALYGQITVDGSSSPEVWTDPPLTATDACPGATTPWVRWMGFDPSQQVFWLTAGIPVPLIPGQSFTISYDASKLAGPAEPIGLQLRNHQTQSMDTVLQVVASNGVLTFTVTGSGGEGVYQGWLEAEIPMTFIATCQEGQTTLEIGELEFIALNDPDNPDDDVSEWVYVDRILCEADPITKSGVWMTDDQGVDYIQWTIDTGHLLPQASFTDYAYSWDWTFTFDCDSVDIQAAAGTAVFEPYPGACEDWDELRYELVQDKESDVDYVRAVITVNAYPVENPRTTSFVNCAYVRSMGDSDKRALAAPATGLGGEACFELFPKEGGDFITKDVDKAEVLTGETITYTVVAETTADRWDYIEVTDELPTGFVIDPDSITCTIEPVVFSASPCYELNDDGVGGKVLSARAVPGILEEGDEEYASGPVKITLTFKGTVTAPAGTSLVNEACSIREINQRMLPTAVRESMGDPTIIGGGVICDDAITRVVVPVSSPTPTPSPTPSPTVTPTPSPTATTPASPEVSPTATDPAPGETPTATTEVTGLPSTGTSDSSSSAFQFLTAALVASVLVAALGIRAAETRR